MKVLGLMAGLMALVLIAGCTKTYIKVTDTQLIGAGSSITLTATGTPGVAMKVEIDLSALSSDVKSQIQAQATTQAKAQGFVMPDLGSLFSTGKCWLVVNCDKK